MNHEKKLVEHSHQNYINILENSSGKIPSLLGHCLNASQDELTIKETISLYSNHISIQKIKSVLNTDSKFDQAKTNCKSYQQNE